MTEIILLVFALILAVTFIADKYVKMMQVKMKQIKEVRRKANAILGNMKQIQSYLNQTAENTHKGELTKMEADKLIMEIIKRVPNDKSKPRYSFIYISGDFKDAHTKEDFEAAIYVDGTPLQTMNLFESLMKSGDGMAVCILKVAKSHIISDLKATAGVNDLLNETLGRNNRKN